MRRSKNAVNTQFPQGHSKGHLLRVFDLHSTPSHTCSSSVHDENAIVAKVAFSRSSNTAVAQQGPCSFVSQIYKSLEVKI